jgi:Spy/CpxP family protein refolding chaperone
MRVSKRQIVGVPLRWEPVSMGCSGKGKFEMKTKLLFSLIGSEHINEKRVKALTDSEASLLARLIVANSRMQSKIYKILSPDQQKKLNDLEKAQGTVTLDSR